MSDFHKRYNSPEKKQDSVDNEELQMEGQILDEILGTDSRIRYAGILDKDLKTASSKARENLGWEKENFDHQMVALASPIILGTLSRFTDKAGKLICCGVRYDKGTLLLFKMGENFVVVSTEPGPPYIIMQKLEENIHI
jgi:hypothetical protein